MNLRDITARDFAPLLLFLLVSCVAGLAVVLVRGSGQEHEGPPVADAIEHAQLEDGPRAYSLRGTGCGGTMLYAPVLELVPGAPVVDLTAAEWWRCQAAFTELADVQALLRRRARAPRRREPRELTPTTPLTDPDVAAVLYRAALSAVRKREPDLRPGRQAVLAAAVVAYFLEELDNGNT